MNDAEPVAQGTCGCGNNVNGPSCVPRQKPEPQILGKYMRLVAEPQVGRPYNSSCAAGVPMVGRQRKCLVSIGVESHRRLCLA